MEGYIAEIRMFAANFAPRNWAYCQGQVLSIAQNTALFSLLGTTYGGNGQTTFALPNFASRVALGTGQGGGLSNVNLGDMAGVETVTLTTNQMPAHNHTATGTVSPLAYNGGGDESSIAGGFPANSTTPSGNLYSAAASSTGAMGLSSASVTIQPNGSNSPHSNLQPYLGMNIIICLYGIFPSRN
jgi:microcystin-dependent protein